MAVSAALTVNIVVLAAILAVVVGTAILWSELWLEHFWEPDGDCLWAHVAMRRTVEYRVKSYRPVSRGSLGLPGPRHDIDSVEGSAFFDDLQDDGRAAGAPRDADYSGPAVAAPGGPIRGGL